MRYVLLIIFIITLFLPVAFAEDKITVLTKEDITNMHSNLRDFEKTDEYPLSIGIEGETGEQLEIRTFCSDVCPDNTIMGIYYTNILSEEECEIKGHYTVKDPAWGGFIGCQPEYLHKATVGKDISEDTIKVSWNPSKWFNNFPEVGGGWTGVVIVIIALSVVFYFIGLRARVNRR